MRKWNRPTAKGEINETDAKVHTGFVTFPDDRKYRFWYHTDKAKIYWDNDKGNTNNIWTGKRAHTTVAPVTRESMYQLNKGVWSHQTSGWIYSRLKDSLF